jgi:hypothetical protein
MVLGQMPLAAWTGGHVLKSADDSIAAQSQEAAARPDTLLPWISEGSRGRSCLEL